MENYRVTKVTYVRKPGFLERIGKSCSGILFGVVFFCFSFVILYYNEERAVRGSQVIDDAFERVISLNLNNIGTFNGELVHHTGLLQIDENTEDPEFGFFVPCVVLRRNVEMYQWIEHSETKEEDVGNEIRKTTTYTYDKEWSKSLIKSRNFEEEIGHQNPVEIIANNKEIKANQVTVDNVHLSQNLINKINWFKPLEKLPPPQNHMKAKLFKNYYYFGVDPLVPEVGNTRVSFDCAGFTDSSFTGKRTIVTVIAMLNQNTFQSYKSPYGGSIELLYQGSRSPDEILASEQSAINSLTWFLRILGCILMFIGLGIMTNIVVTLVGWIPFVRELITFSLFLFNISIAISLSLITIALSWVRFRPVFATTIAFTSLLPWLLSKLGTNFWYKRKYCI